MCAWLSLGHDTTAPIVGYNELNVIASGSHGSFWQVEPTGGLQPLPLSHCADECHRRGTCAVLYDDLPELRTVQCLCHTGCEKE